MNPYAIPALVALVINLCLGAYVLRKDPKKELNIVFALMLFSFAWFSLGIFMLMDSTEIGTAVFWTRVGAGTAIPLICAFTLHVVSVFPKSLLFFGKRKQALALVYFLAIVFALLSQSDLVFQGVREYPWGFQANAGLLFPFPYLAFALSVLAWILFLLVRAHTRTTGTARKQVDYVLAGACTVAVMSMVGDTLPLLFGSYFMPTLTVYSFTIFGVLIAYAILKYKLFILPPMARFFIPATEAHLLTKPKYRLARGRSYLICWIKMKKFELGPKIFRDLTTHGTPGLWVTTSHPKRIRKDHGLERTPILCLRPERVRGEATLPPDQLGKVVGSISSYFFRMHQRSVVLVDCFRELVVVNGFEKAMDFLRKLKRVCSENESNLIVVVDCEKFTEKEIDEIEKALARS